MTTQKLLFYLILSISTTSFGAPFVLTEKSLLELAQKSNAPGFRNADIAYLDAQKAKSEALDNLSANLYTFAQTGTTKENALIQFMPVFTPTRTYGVGIKKNSKFGLSYDLSFSGDQRSASSLNLDNASTAKINLDLKIDLWNDFLGSKTKKLLDIGDLNERRVKLNQTLQKKKHILSIRRVYWQIIAVKESLDVMERIYKLAKIQVGEINKRYKNSIADKATLSLFNSQLMARSAQRNKLKYNYEMALRQLKVLLPALNTKEIVLGDYNINATVNNVLQCTSMISSYGTAPVKYTPVDDMVELLKEIQRKEMAVNSKHANIDVFMEANIRNTGIESSQTESGTLSGAIDDFRENDRKGYDVGIFVNIPLGGQKKTTEDIKKRLTKDKYISLIETMSANLDSTHVQIKSTIRLLVDLIKNQKDNNRFLNTRLAEMNKKYKQARINYTDFISDQNNALSSDLAVIETELMILNTIFDYLEVFPDMPCSLNI